MHPFRVVRRLLSRAHEDWQDAVEGLFSQPHPRRPVGPRPLRVMRLERRRVLSADFSLTATGLVLSGFDDAGGDTLTVQQEGDAYQFTSASGWEQHEPGQMPEGVTIDGDTLSVDRAVLEGLEDGLTIRGSLGPGNLGKGLDVRLGDADFSSLSGPVTLDGVTSVGQEQPFALFTTPTDGFQLIVAPAGTVLSSLNVSGDLNIISIGGSITDAPGSEILISGNATFTSRAASPAGDFNGDGLVDQTDYTEHWAKNYGMTSGATQYQGDANGDGRVDAADYTLWRDTVGQTGQGGIELANQAGDRLVIGGVATFDAAEAEGTHDIYVGVGGHAEFGSVNAYGANVIIHEDATAGDSGPTTVLGNIQAYTLQVESGGKITDTPDAQIIVNGDASFTVTEAAMIADGSLVQAIVLADQGGTNRLQVGGVATFIVEHPTTEVIGFTGPKGIDVGVVADGQMANAIFNAGSLRFYAPGGTVRIAEDSGTVLAGWDAVEGPVAAITAAPTASVAHTLELQSVGGISDDADAVVQITGNASFYSTTTIVLADSGVANVLSVDGLATFLQNPNATGIDVGVTSAGLAAAATFNAGSLRFHSNSGAVRIAEDSSTVLVGRTTTPAPTVFPNAFADLMRVRGLEISSAGSITDEADLEIHISGNATFVAKDEIVLADGVAANSRLSVFAVATFISTDGEDISVGVNSAGTSTTTAFTAGSIRFVSVGGDVKIAEDDPMELADWAPISIAPSVPMPTPTSSVAGNLELVASTSITDATNAMVHVTGNATFIARNIILADTTSVGTSNALTVGGVATFLSTGNSATLQVGTTTSGAPTPAQFQAGSLRFYLTNGLVRIAEDDSMLLADWMTVPSSPLFVTPWITTPRMASEARTIELLSAASISDTENATLLATTRNLVTGVRFYSPDSSATFVAAGSITLADGGADNKLMVDGVATFVSTAASGQRIDVGVTPTGGMADAEFIAGSVRFWAPDGTVRLVEDAAVNLKGATYSETPGTVIGSWPGAASRIIPNTVVSNRTGSLEIVSHGPITDASTTVVEVTGDAGFRVIGVPVDVPGNASIRLADDGASNQLLIDGVATFIIESSATGPAGPQGIDVGVDASGVAATATFNAGSLRFYAPGGAVRIAETGSTLLAGWGAGEVSTASVAHTLQLQTYGDIYDTGDAVILITGVAADGSLAYDPTASATLYVSSDSTGDISLADERAANVFSVDGLATFIARTLSVGVSGLSTPAESTFNAGSLRFVSAEFALIAEDSDTVLVGWTTQPALPTFPVQPNSNQAGSLVIFSGGSISDEADFRLTVATSFPNEISGSATFVAKDQIVLADGITAANALRIDRVATFISTDGDTISVGATAAGVAAPAVFNAGSVRFVSVGGSVRIAEDSDTTLANWESVLFPGLLPSPMPTTSIAGHLELASAASIADVANAAINVTGNATFVAGANLTLVDSGGANSLTVDGLATFAVGNGRTLNVGVTPAGVQDSGAFRAGSLRFSALNGVAKIAEDDATLLAGWPMGSTSPLLGETPPMATEAKTIEIFSGGNITDAPDAVIIATGRNSSGVRFYDPTASATFVASQSITLADQGPSNKLIIDGGATFISVPGSQLPINVGVTNAGAMAAAEFVAGSIRFSAQGGAIRIVEDAAASFKDVVYAETPGTVLSGWAAGTIPPLVPASVNRSVAGSLELVSNGPLIDAVNANVEVAGAAGFRVLGSSVTVADNVWIRLADAGGDNRLIVGGAATFVVDGTRGIDVGVTPTGTPAAAEFTAGSLRFVAGGAVRIAEDNATQLAGWGDLPVGLIRQAGVGSSQAQTLELLSTQSITNADGLQLRVTDDATFIASGAGAEPWAINLADGAEDTVSIGDLATFIVTAENKGIRIGVGPTGTPANAAFIAGRLRFSAPTGDVEIAEDRTAFVGGVSSTAAPGTLLAGWTTDAVSPLLTSPAPTMSQAKSVQLVSAGPITDATDAIIDVTVDAGFLVTEAAAISVNNLAIRLADSDSPSTINRLTVGGFATFVTLGGGGIQIGDTPRSGPAEATFNAGALRFYAPNSQVSIAEDSGTSLAKATTEGVLGLGGPLPASVAGSLGLTSNGVISDELGAAIEITGAASFNVSSIANVGDDRAIVLANDSRLVVGGFAYFKVAQEPAGLTPKGIDVGVTAAGTPSSNVFTAGALAFDAAGAVVRIAEDDGTFLVGVSNVAGQLELLSAGAITDEASARLQIAGDATFVSALETVLANSNLDQLSIGGVATFVVGPNQTLAVGTSALGLASLAEFNAGSLRFFAPNGTARIAEDSATEFVDWMTVAPSALIAVPPMVIEAKAIEIFSAGSITDTPTAVIIATGNSGGVRVYDPTATATFVATNSITLADAGADNKLIVDGMLTLVSTTGAAQQINVGVTGAGAVAAAEFVAGSVRFSAPGGVVKIAEDASAAFKGVTYNETPGTHIAGWTPGTISALIVAPPTRSAAASLEITSAGAITDAADAKVLIAGDAKFTVSTIANVAGSAAITLADGDAANELVIGGHANFLVNQVPAGGGAKGIDVGVVSATGVPAAALFTAGTLGFSAQGGMVRLAEDNDTVLGGFSTAQDLELLSAGFVTDTTSVTTDDGVAATSVTLTQSAKLKAGVNGENDVTLGAGAAAFSMGTPQLFNDAQYLAVQAENVSIHADSGVNVRTGDAPLSNLDNYSQFAGTFYLAATGHVSQVTTATPKSLTADKISVESDNGAVLLRLVELTSTGTDPNLQIKSGGSVALSQPLVGGGTVGDKFAGSSIPSPTSPAFAPVIVEADNPLTGERPNMPARPNNPGFEDVLLAGGENSRLSEAVRLPNGDYVVDHLLQDGGQTRTIDDLYSMVVVVTGDANVGDVHDPNTDARRDVDTAESRGVAIENGGNAFLSTLAGGDLFFTNRNREGGDQLDGIAVQMAGGVFTAIAAGTLRIDTEDPDNLAANLRTTRLVSKTGTVTNVNSDSATEFGPRAILDPSTEEGNAATSGLVRADQNFEQRITMAIGSRGEDNLLVEVEWADTADIRQFSNANVRLPADPNVPTNTVGSTSVPGSRPYADVVQTPVGAIEANVADQSVTGYQYQTLAGTSRVATVTHNYDEAFVPNNPAQNRLPTTVRVFNDSAINLFDQGGARNLNSVSFSIAPRIITLPPSGFFIISTPELPQRYEPVSVTLPRAEPTQVTQQTTSDDGRAVTVSSAEDVLYGRVDEKGEWIVDIPGESWPQVMEDAEGDFLREIRDKIDEGPYSKGRYVIKVVTPRSEQLLEEWVKGDDAEVDAEAAAKPAVAAPVEDAVLPAEGAQPAAPMFDGPVDAPAVIAPQGAPLGLLELESAPSDARQVAFAAMAAVGVWRRRLNEAGPFTLDADGVAFTRVKRQRRRRGGE